MRAIVNIEHFCIETTSFRRVEVKRSLFELAEIELRKESGEKSIDLLFGRRGLVYGPNPIAPEYELVEYVQPCRWCAKTAINGELCLY